MRELQYEELTKTNVAQLLVPHLNLYGYIPGMSKNVIKKRSFDFLQILDDAILHRVADDDSLDDEARDEEKENVILDMSQRMNDNVDFDSRYVCTYPQRSK